MILFGSHDHAKSIARAARIGYDPDVHFVISRVGPQLLGGVIYTHFTGRSVQMHQAGFAPRWATPQFMWAIYDFPFNQLKVERVFALVSSTNRRALGITEKMGFQYVTTIPGTVLGGDTKVHSMSRDECRWLKLAQRFSTGLEEKAA